MPVFKDNPITIKNEIARVWDEADRGFKVTIYEKEYYHSELFIKPHYTLPVVRYGIYERDGRLVCRISSIQNKRDIISEKLSKTIGRQKYRVNKDVYEEDQTDVEPANLIALAIFINCLHVKGITCIEAPSFYTLDFQYHIKGDDLAVRDFEEFWTEYKIARNPEKYAKAKEELMSGLNKAESVVKHKSENFLKTLLRLMQHYPNVTVESYPTEVENFLRMVVPVVQSKDDIDNPLLQELFTLTATGTKRK